MARIFQTGFETPPYFHPWMSGNCVIATNYRRTGVGSMRVYSGVMGGSSHSQSINLPEGYTELYFRWAMMVRNTFEDNYLRIYVYSNTDQTLFYMDLKQAAMSLSGLGWSTQTYTFPTPWATGEWHLCELHIKMDAVDGETEFLVDGQRAAFFQGNTLGTGAHIRNITFSSQRQKLNSRDSETFYDDIAINDPSGSRNNSWCGDGYIGVIRPTGVGDSSQWIDQAGNQTANWAAVDEATADGDTTYVKAVGADLVDLYSLGNVALADGHVLNTVQVSAIARVDVPGTDTIAVGCKLGLNEQWDNADLLLHTYSMNPGRLMELAPDGAPWNEDKLNNLQAGIKSVGS